MPPHLSDRVTATHWLELLGRRFDTPDQAWVTRNISQRLGGVIAALAFRFGGTPNGLTYIGMVFMLAGSAAYATVIGWNGAVLACLLWQIGFGFDCADGQLARAKGVAGAYGAWLDVACDHVRQISINLALLAALLGGDLPLQLEFAACFLLLSGQATLLHTITILKFVKSPPTSFKGQAATLRQIFKTLIDTPVFLFMLCAMRSVPMLLVVFCAGYGLMLILQSWSLGRMRVNQAIRS